MKRFALFLVPLLAAILSACPDKTTPPQPPLQPSVSRIISAATGGNLELAGAALMIPAMALDKDATVTLGVGATPAAKPADPYTPSGPEVRVDLGGATTRQALTLSLPGDVTDGQVAVLLISASSG